LKQGKERGFRTRLADGSEAGDIFEMDVVVEVEVHSVVNQIKEFLCSLCIRSN